MNRRWQSWSQAKHCADEPMESGEFTISLENRTASLPDIASPVCLCGSGQKGPHTPQRELPSATRIRLRSEKRPRQRKQLARLAVQGILYNQSHVSTVLSRRKVEAISL